MKINVRGVEHNVRVDGEGVFYVTVDGIRYTSDTFADLREKVMAGMADPAVEVPFTVIEHGIVRNGVATGTRRVDGSVLAVWDDTGSYGVVTWNTRTLKRLGEGDADTYRRLVAARDAAQHAVERFERPRTIDLGLEVHAAARAAAANVHMARYTESGRDTGHAVCGAAEGVIAGDDDRVTCTGCIEQQDAQFAEARRGSASADTREETQ